MKRIPLIQFGKLIVFLTIFFFTTQFSFAAPTSLLFHGTGEGDVDRLKIVVAYPTKPVDVGEDFTIEWWMKASINNNQGECVDELDDGWSYGNILFDREIFGNGAFGSYGIALGSGRISFGVHNGTWGKTVCGSTYVADNQWHHIAVTREMDSGTMKIFVDGELDTTGIGPSGNVSYNYGGGEGGTGQFYLVVGAEKYDLDSELFPPYSGRIDEIRFSGVIRYDSNFLPQTEPFETDEDTLALFHLDEGTGTSVNDTSGALGGPSPGAIQVGGSPEGPEWSSDSPFDISTIDSSTGGSSSGSGGGSGGSGGGSGGSSSSGGTTELFPDVSPEHTFFEYIQDLAENKIISGFGDGTFRPDEYVTRAQMTKFVANGFGFISLDDSCKLFPDIREKHTFYSYATTLKCKGIVSGYPDGKFGPDDPLTRGQAMKFVVVGSRVAKGNEDFLPLLQNNVFPDVPQTHTFYENIHAAYSHSIVNGYPNGEFGPDDQITRGQMAKMISNGRAKINEDLGL